MWDLNDIDTPESESVQAEREIWEAEPPADADDCDRCGKRRELYHNEATGLALCDDCDRTTDQVEALLSPPETVAEAVLAPIRWKRLRNGAWGVTGPDTLVREGAIVSVEKRDGSTSTATVSRVLWSGDGKAIASVRK